MKSKFPRCREVSTYPHRVYIYMCVSVVLYVFVCVRTPVLQKGTELSYQHIFSYIFLKNAPRYMLCTLQYFLYMYVVPFLLSFKYVFCLRNDSYTSCLACVTRCDHALVVVYSADTKGNQYKCALYAVLCACGAHSSVHINLSQTSHCGDRYARELCITTSACTVQ